MICRFVRRRACGILTRLLAISFTTAIWADSPPGFSPWIGSGLHDTGISTADGVIATMSPAGELFVAIASLGPACPAPNFTLGNSASGSFCVSKFAASGQPVFSTQIGGASFSAIALDASGNVLIAGTSGLTGAGFATTPGAYKAAPPGSPNPILCKLSGSDGHPLFGTFVDVSVLPADGFIAANLVVDSADNAYIEGPNVSSGASTIEQINATGTAAGYLTGFGNAATIDLVLAVDANSNLYCAYVDTNGTLRLEELNPAGAVMASIAGPLGNLPLAGLAVDPSGNPEELLVDNSAPGTFRLRKYGAGLSTLLFDVAINAGSILSMAVDSAGITDIFGYTGAIDLTQVNPTQSCVQSATQSAGLGAPPPENAFLLRIDPGGNVLQSTYLQAQIGVPQATITAGTAGAYVTFPSVTANVTTIYTMTLAPASARIALACAGNAASFVEAPLAPDEIIVVFGAGFGPATPITTVPDATGLYPSEVGGVQITFDGVAAPLLYASNSQVNLVAPAALSGKSTTQICAVLNGAVANCLNAAVAAAAPAMFSSGLFNGLMYAAAVNQDSTINSEQNPAPAGSVISLYVTGLGATTPTLPDGSITPVPLASQNLQVTVTYTLNELRTNMPHPLPAQVLYAGPAPLEIEGLGQVNVVAPGGPAPVFLQLLVISADGTQTYNTGPSLAIWTR
jgi:uncharacterized protein (TIGR03437 family)